MDRQLQETYGETIADLNRTGHETRRARIVLCKLDVPPLVVTRVVRSVTEGSAPTSPLRLRRPRANGKEGLRKAVYTVAEQESTYSVLRQLGETVEFEAVPEEIDAYSAAVELAGRYRLEPWAVIDELRRLYPVGGPPRRLACRSWPGRSRNRPAATRCVKRRSTWRWPW